MNTENPADVMRTLGEIEDKLASEIEPKYPTATERLIRAKAAHKLAEAQVAQRAEGDTIPQRQAHIQRLLAAREEHDDLINAEVDVATVKALLEVLDMRRSIGQSVLKMQGAEIAEKRFGRGSGPQG